MCIQDFRVIYNCNKCIFNGSNKVLWNVNIKWSYYFIYELLLQCLIWIHILLILHSISQFSIVNTTCFLFSNSTVSGVLDLEKKFLWFLGLCKSNLIDSELDLQTTTGRLNWNKDQSSEILLLFPNRGQVCWCPYSSVGQVWGKFLTSWWMWRIVHLLE
jgi:hypothetical protein